MDPNEAAHDEPSQLDLLFANSATCIFVFGTASVNSFPSYGRSAQGN